MAVVSVFSTSIATSCLRYTTSTRPKNKEFVVFIHGFADRPYTMWKIEKQLQKEGYSVLNFDYSSTKWTMDTIVVRLHDEIVDKCKNAEKIHFVTHSYGGLIIRAYLSQYLAEIYGRLVMIAPLNQGSIIVEQFEDVPVFKKIYGPVLEKLGKDPDDYFMKYPIPEIPFGIIAGGLNNKYGFNPLIPGDDDGTLAVEETKLQGCQDFILKPGLHSTLLWQNEVIKQIILFLEEGRFEH